MNQDIIDSETNGTATTQRFDLVRFGFGLRKILFSNIQVGLHILHAHTHTCIGFLKSISTIEIANETLASCYS